MKRKAKKKQQAKTTKFRSDDYVWVVGLVPGDIRAKSFEVAHAKRGSKLLCGRARTVKWAGYKRKRIARFVAPAPYERKCKRCLFVIYPPQPRRKRR